MDAEALRALEDQATKAALASGHIDDLEKAANIAKQAAEIRKVISDTVNQPKLVRYEEGKTWAALLIPFLSIATLAVTIYIQADQLNATREANQDTQWREAVKNVLSQLSRPASVVADPSMALSLLDPYTSDKRFGREATFLAIRLLLTTPSSDRFQDFVLSHHIGESWSDVHSLTDLSRDLYNQLTELNLRTREPNHDSILDAARSSTIENIEFITERLCSLYRANPSLTQAADFRDVFLLNGDLSGVDLTGADLTGAKLQNVNLANADLGGTVRSKNTLFLNTHWWDARKITKPLLQFLTESQYPYFEDDLTYDVPPPDRESYVARVRKLCGDVGLSCPADGLKYGVPTPSKQVEPK